MVSAEVKPNRLNGQHARGSHPLVGGTAWFLQTIRPPSASDCLESKHVSSNVSRKREILLEMKLIEKTVKN